MTSQRHVVHRFADPAALGRALGAEIADRIEPSLAAGGRFVLGCPGGRTPTSTIAALADDLGRRRLDLRGLVIAMMDDYLEPRADGWRAVDAAAHHSCRRFAREEIQAVLNSRTDASTTIPDANVWFPDPASPADYDARLADAGGIDFFILASGAGDGHVAFNPPGSSRESRTRVVELAKQTRMDNLATFPDFTGLDEVPTHGITVGIATIAEQSAAAAMVLIGADKQTAFRRLTAGDGYDPDWPATVYRLIDGAALYVDAAAAPTTDPEHPDR